MNSSNKRVKPDYFLGVAEKALGRWKQLEADPELAGPWHQLFSQVQSPRHVLSELLQNADDAGAQHVKVRVEGDNFIFEHDGKDFSQSEFESLCRFGYSNKRNLHTIGFRGIGFKSTFSLGDQVDVISPSLAVRFEKSRFTLPRWLNGAPHLRTKTVVRVKMADPRRLKELQKNIDEWLVSPASLLFFKNVLSINLIGHQISREYSRKGPSKNSAWYKLSGKETREVLLVTSEPVAFPEDAIAEIKKERNADDLNLPPCQIELVLGLDSSASIYVVLPTGVKPKLPFSINGPFLQDPARFGIKDPAVSPTNRWLLNRAGKLAATVLEDWLHNRSLTISETAEAYQLLPPPPPVGSGTSENVSLEVYESFKINTLDRHVVLTESGDLEKAATCSSLPKKLHNVWKPNLLADIFCPDSRGVLSSAISSQHQNLLALLHWVNPVTEKDVIDRLVTSPGPKPDNWEALTHLWDFISRLNSSVCSNKKLQTVQIIPAKGQDHLTSANQLIRLSNRQSAFNENDLEFLNRYVQMVDPDWLDFLRSLSKEHQNDQDSYKTTSTLNRCLTLLSSFSLDSPSSTEEILSQAFETITCKEETNNLVRLTHIFAATDSSVPKDFRYITRNNQSRSVVSSVLIDPDGILEDALDHETAENEIIHDIYFQTEAAGCNPRTWIDWALSSKSRLSTIPAFETEKKEFQTQEGLEAFLAERGCEKPTEYHYKSRSFYFIRDTFLPSEIIQHLDQVIEHEPLAWANYLNLFFKGDPQSWNRHFKTTVYELAANRHNQRKAKCEPVNASWICELSQKPCLLDTFNRPRMPAELLLRSPETEPLMGIECFVQAEIDTPDNRDLLEALGARTTPTGPDKLLDRIKALSGMESPPIQEIVKWYEAINKVVARSEPEDIRNLANRFKETPLIYTQDCGWAKIDEVFRFMDEDGLPDTPVVHSAISDLRMWPRLGLADKPTIDLVLKWLHTLPTDSALDAGTKRRVKSCLQNYPETVWTECGQWLSLDGHWANINSLSFKLLRNHKIQTGDLFAGIHRTTADLRNLNDTDCQLSQFSELRDLATCLQMQLAQSTPSSRPQPEITWLETLGQLISRVHVPDDPDQAKTFQVLGKRLSNSRWNAMKMLQVTPYLDGEPAGQPHQAKVFWHQENIYVVEGSFVANYQKLVNEIARPFASQKISDAIRACVQRDTQFISEYFASHFELMEPEETRQPTEDFQLTPENPSSSFSTTESESRGTTNPEFAEKPLTFNTQENRNKEHVSEDIVGREHLHASSEYDFSHNLDSADDFPSISENGIPLETDRHVQEPPATETEYPQEAHGSHEPEIENGAFETFLHESDPISLLNENDASLNQFLESDLSDESSVTTFNRDETANSIDPEQAIENPEKQKPQRTARASIIEQWAEQEAFVWLLPNQNARTENGRKLQRASGLFHWEICSTDGQIESRLWVTSQSLIEGVELPAEIWNVAKQSPNDCGFIFSDNRNEPLHISGDQMMELFEDGSVKLFPAKYRIRHIGELKFIQQS